MPAELQTIIDLIRYGASRFGEAGLTFGHSYDNAMDESTQLVLHTLHLPHDLNPIYGASRVTAEEKAKVLAQFQRRIHDRIPACYLTGEAWFAGLSFKSDRRALVPRSPIAELILNGFQPWIGDVEVHDALDLCTGGGCIAIAMGHYNPSWNVDAVDLSPEALALARENVERLDARNVTLHHGDLYGPLTGRHYDLIVTNPPYVNSMSMAKLPAEYKAEPQMALAGGDDGMDLVRRILAGAKERLTPDGVLVVEIGNEFAHAEAAFADLELTWLSTSVGDEAVFLLTADQL